LASFLLWSTASGGRRPKAEEAHMFRAIVRASLLMLLALALAAPASAQVIQSVQVGVGVVLPRGYDARSSGDVLAEDLYSLLFQIKDFESAQLSGDWNVAFGDHIEFGAGIGYYRRTVPSVYADLVNENGREIQQDLGLRVVPVTAVVRFLPFGRAGGFQPYVGVGVGGLRWRYTESGEFVDYSDYSVFRARYIATGTAPAGVILGGFRAPIGGDIYAFTFETRYITGTGDIGTDKGFLSDKIDLTSTQVNFGFLVRF
jgi:hypothetical protein